METLSQISEYLYISYDFAVNLVQSTFYTLLSWLSYATNKATFLVEYYFSIIGNISDNLYQWGEKLFTGESGKVNPMFIFYVFGYLLIGGIIAYLLFFIIVSVIGFTIFALLRAFFKFVFKVVFFVLKIPFRVLRFIFNPFLKKSPITVNSSVV